MIVKSRFLIWSIIGALSLCLNVHAVNNTEQIRFKHFSVDDGLSQSTVLAIEQDGNGAIWMGTNDGLNRYDSYQFKTYRNTAHDTTSLADNTINALLVDTAGQLWVGTSAGLSLYNYSKDCFDNFNVATKGITIFAINETADRKSLILATDIGLAVFDKQSHTYDFRRQLSGIAVHALCNYKNMVLVGTAKGLFCYSVQLGTIERIIPEFESYDIAAIAYIPQYGLYIATHGNGLFLLDDQMRITSQYNRANSLSKGFTSDYLRVLKGDNNSRLWVGTVDGLFIFDAEQQLFTPYKYDPADPTSLSHNSIRSIFSDTQGGMWVGTYYGGVNYYNALCVNFSTIQRSLSSNSLGDNTISCIVEEPGTGNMWIGTNDNGVTYYNIATKRFNHYIANSTNRSLKSNNIKCILTEPSGNIYIGTHSGGLSYLEKGSGTVTTYQIYNDIPINNSCYSLLDQGDGTLWIGTLRGMLSFDKKSGIFSLHPIAKLCPALGEVMITSIFTDSAQNIWIGTANGIYMYNPLQRIVEHIIDDKYYVMSIAEDSAGVVWVGTRQGLLGYDVQSKKLSHLTSKQGLPNDFIYGILEDDTQSLWLSTNKGLTCYNPKRGTMRHYTKSDGLCNNQFNIYSYCKSSSGELYFGGINGITHFNPRQLIDNPFAPKVLVTNISLLYDDELSQKAVNSIRDSLGNITSSSFSSQYNLFNIKFVVINHIATGRNQFRYMLDGFDKTWYKTTNREINYSNLSPGHYTLLVQAANNDGKWSEEITRVELRIRPMWYQTLLAKFIYLIMLAGAIYVGFRFFISRAKMRMQLLLERIEKRKIAELSEEKIRFYINISHELRTPLALILSPLQEIIDTGVHDKFIRSRLEYIRRNSTRLLHIINQLLEYRKAELGMLKIKVAMIDVDSVVADVFSMFEENANNRDMDYIFNSSIGGRKFPCDKMFIEVLMTNLLSNAFKFTPDAGTIKISLTEADNRLTIIVHDNGVGIAKENIDKMFDRFYQENESHSGTGIGLSIVKRLVAIHHGTIHVDSTQGEYMQFTITLPTDIGEYSTEEIAATDEMYSAQIGKSRDVSLFIEEDYTKNDTLAANTEQGYSDQKQETLLIVDDNQEMLGYLQDNFRERFNILTASNGTEALETLKRVEPDIVITDLMMEGMGGFELCKAIKQNIRTCHISVIILTAKEDIEEQIAAIEVGADEYLFKPFSISILKAKVANLLKAKYRHRHHYINTTEVEPEKITSNALDGDFIKRAIEIVERNIDNEEFTSHDFSRELCMSRSNLHLKMTSLTGESAAKFIRKIRLNHACKLLVEGKFTISEISSMVGFSTPSYFATCFKKHIGCMPTEYVKSHK